mmetsp:Transcript_34960/g.54649  ORF Transcript_34960/g.54649 Transcript_34960/m.54649 type:complete len:84 (+) Transcript_34960:657-908(+)
MTPRVPILSTTTLRTSLHLSRTRTRSKAQGLIAAGPQFDPEETCATCPEGFVARRQLEEPHNWTELNQMAIEPEAAVASAFAV